MNYISDDKIPENEIKQIIEGSLSIQGLEEFRNKMLNNKLDVF